MLVAILNLQFKKKTNPFWFDQFVTKLEEHEVLDIQIFEDSLNLLEVDSDFIDQAESTIDILNKSLKTIGLKPEVESKLEILLRNLYQEANLLQS